MAAPKNTSDDAKQSKPAGESTALAEDNPKTDWDDTAFNVEYYCNTYRAANGAVIIKEHVVYKSDAWHRLRQRVIVHLADGNRVIVQMEQVRRLDMLGLATKEESELAERARATLNDALDGNCVVM